MDTYKNGTVFPEDLRKALGSSSLGLNPRTIDSAVKMAIRDHKGAVKYKAFLKQAESLFAPFILSPYLYSLYISQYVWM